MNDETEYRVREGETLNEYLIRVSQIKDLYQLTWSEIGDIILEQFGESLSSNAIRKRAKRLSKSFADYCQAIDEVGNGNDESELSELDLIALEKQKLSDTRVSVNAAYRRISREDTIKEIAMDAVKQMASARPFPIVKEISTSDDSKSALLLISDWHFGIEIKSVFNTYNPDICKKRVGILLSQVQRLLQINNIKNLTIANLGDMIAGGIHLPIRLNSRIDVITQIMNVSEILADFLQQLSTTCHIDYYSVLDNHSRIYPNKKDSLQLESLARITEWYIDSRTENNPNISVHKDNEFGFDIATFELSGKKILCVHGDLDKQMTMVEKLSNYTHAHYDLMCAAHMHHFSADENNETVVICNSSLMGTDDYASSLRLNCKPSQTMIIFNDRQINIVKIDVSC